MSDALWTVAAAILCNVSCAVLGCYLVLRRMSLLGDAISHAVLPGLVVAYLFAGQNGLALATGAAVLGVLTAFLTQGVRQIADVPEDAQYCGKCENYLSKEDAPPDRKPAWVWVCLILALLASLATTF